MEKIKIGKIVNTHGIKGELKVAFDDSLLFEKGMNIFIKVRNDYMEYTINSLRMHKNHLLITIGDYTNINEVLKYKSCDIYANRDNDEVYISDLVGYEVIENGKVVSEVEEIINNGAQDILVLKNEIMIPYVDEFVKEIDDVNNCIKVELIEGMYNED